MDVLEPAGPSGPQSVARGHQGESDHGDQSGDDEVADRVGEPVPAGIGEVSEGLVGPRVAVPGLVPAEVGYAGFLVATYALVPAAVAIAVTRHDLLDVDRLLSDTVAVVATSLVAALIWAGTVVVVESAVRETADGLAHRRVLAVLPFLADQSTA